MQGRENRSLVALVIQSFGNSKSLSHSTWTHLAHPDEGAVGTLVPRANCKVQSQGSNEVENKSRQDSLCK